MLKFQAPYNTPKSNNSTRQLLDSSAARAATPNLQQYANFTQSKYHGYQF